MGGPRGVQLVDQEPHRPGHAQGRQRRGDQEDAGRGGVAAMAGGERDQVAERADIAALGAALGGLVEGLRQGLARRSAAPRLGLGRQLTDRGLTHETLTPCICSGVSLYARLPRTAPSQGGPRSSSTLL